MGSNKSLNIEGFPTSPTSLFYLSANLGKSSCGRSSTQLLHTFEKTENPDEYHLSNITTLKKKRKEKWISSIL
jgi:hypothetical protein